MPQHTALWSLYTQDGKEEREEPTHTKGLLFHADH